MSSRVSTRVHSINPGIKETWHFGTTSKFYIVLLIFQTLESFRTLALLEIKLFGK